VRAVIRFSTLASGRFATPVASAGMERCAVPTLLPCALAAVFSFSIQIFYLSDNSVPPGGLRGYGRLKSSELARTGMIWGFGRVLLVLRTHPACQPTGAAARSRVTEDAISGRSGGGSNHLSLGPASAPPSS